MKIIITFFLICIFTSVAHSGDFKQENGIPKKTEFINVVIPVYNLRIALRLPIDWRPAYEYKNDNAYLLEFTPKNESIENWNNMVSIQAFKNVSEKISYERFLDVLASRFKAACGQSFIYEKIGTSVIDGHKVMTAITGCSTLPKSSPNAAKKGQSEIGYYFSIQSENDIYLISKSLRGASFKPDRSPLTKENAQDFIKDILPIQLCKDIGQPHECLK